MTEDAAAVPERSGLAFFGAMTASATHEIRNCLAIVREVCGLIEDLRRDPRGPGLSPERLGKLLEKIERQVARADRVLVRLNRFAHSTDRERVVVDVADLLELVAGLEARTAEMRKVAIEVRADPGSAVFEGDGFLLMQVVHLALVLAFEAAREGERIALALARAGASARILVDGGRPLPLDEAGEAAGLHRAAGRLGARVGPGPEGFGVAVELDLSRGGEP